MFLLRVCDLCLGRAADRESQFVRSRFLQEIHMNAVDVLVCTQVCFNLKLAPRQSTLVMQLSCSSIFPTFRMAATRQRVIDVIQSDERRHISESDTNHC